MKKNILLILLFISISTFAKADESNSNKIYLSISEKCKNFHDEIPTYFPDMDITAPNFDVGFDSDCKPYTLADGTETNKASTIYIEAAFKDINEKNPNCNLANVCTIAAYQKYRKYRKTITFKTYMSHIKNNNYKNIVNVGTKKHPIQGVFVQSVCKFHCSLNELILIHDGEMHIVYYKDPQSNKRTIDEMIKVIHSIKSFQNKLQK
jgi:hypothetical protein